MPTVQEITLQHDRYVTATVSAYKARLDDLIAQATARTLANLSRRLKTDESGVIAATAVNRKIIRNLDSLFLWELDVAGFEALNKAYAGQFAGSLPYLDQIVDQLSEQMKTPLPKTKEALDADARRELAAQQATTVDSLGAVAETVAASAKRQALFSFAGLDFADLSATIARAFGKTSAQAVNLADTAMTSFFRQAAGQVFDEIQADTPDAALRYKYQGPDDRLTRPFCKHILEAHKTYTRAEIDQMNAGPNQPAPVWLFCGGWSCRHVWGLVASK